MKKIIKILFFILLIGILLISSYFIYMNLKEDKKQEDIYKEILEIAENKEEIEKDNLQIKQLEINIEELYQINSDIIGWLKIDGTNINYPVMQTKDNPEYYLRKDFYKKYSYWGTPFLAENCDINTSDNLIIYGHHIKGFKMFGELEHYKNKEYYDKHKTINIYTLNDERKYEIIYVFRTFTNTKFDYYNYINFNDESEFNTFNSKCKELAFFDTQIQCNYGDKFITLSTCDYTSENARFVVIAKQIK